MVSSFQEKSLLKIRTRERETDWQRKRNRERKEGNEREKGIE